MNAAERRERITGWQLQAAINIARVCRLSQGYVCSLHMGHVKNLAAKWRDVR